jgi:hypothetical protein
VDRVVPAAAREQVPEDAGPEHERGQDPPAAARRVEAHPRPDRDDLHSRQVRPLSPRPLAQRQVGDPVSARD